MSKENLTVIPSPGDGHCLVHSIHSSLAGQCNVFISSSDMLSKCRSELVEHFDTYSAFYIGDDLLGEFDEHANNNAYNLQVVDIILQILANTLDVSVVVADVRGHHIIETTFPPRLPNPFETASVVILRKGEHFDGLKMNNLRGMEDTDSGESLFSKPSKTGPTISVKHENVSELERMPACKYSLFSFLEEIIFFSISSSLILC